MAEICHYKHEEYIIKPKMISVEDEQRIIRSCGWLPNVESMRDRECFTRTGTHQVRITCGNLQISKCFIIVTVYQVMVHHCVCQGDGCNGSSNMVAATFLLLSTQYLQIM